MDHRETIQRSLDFIEANLKTDITAEELAQQAGFSLFHYYRLFQSAAGMPVMQYILRRRLLHAIYDIRRGSSKIDAALAYGFDTYPGFYKAFQRELGCTPSEFLKHHRAKRPWSPNLFKEEHMTVTHKKAAEILKHWNLEAEPITDIYYDGGSRSENACYVGDGFVLKYTPNLGKLKNHADLSKAIESIGLSAAVPVKTADGREYVSDGELFFYLTRRLSGSQMTAASLYEGGGAEKARFVGEIIGQLHLALCRVDCAASDADLYETVKTWALPASRAAMDLPDSFCAEYLSTLAALYPSLPRQIIHRDPNPGNIILSGDKWGFLDFDLSERNVRIYDPCYAATAVLSESFSEEKLPAWLGIYQNLLLGYDSVVHLTEEERRAAPYILLANQLVCVAWFAGQEKYAEVFETNKRMTRWLVDHFEELRID